MYLIDNHTISPEYVDAVLYDVGSMPTQPLRQHPNGIDSCPCERISIKEVQVLEMLRPRVPPEQVEFVSVLSHRMSITSEWYLPLNWRLVPMVLGEVQYLYFVKAFLSVISSEKIQLLRYSIK
jgi:hypothetical protein